MVETDIPDSVVVIPDLRVVIPDLRVVIPDLIRDPAALEHWIAGQARNDNRLIGVRFQLPGKHPDNAWLDRAPVDGKVH